MTTENLVTIDFDSEIVNNNNEIDVNEKNQNNPIFHSQEIDLIPDVSFKDHNHNLEDSDTITGESQPLLGGEHHDHHDHTITYNQFPGESIFVSSNLLRGNGWVIHVFYDDLFH